MPIGKTKYATTIHINILLNYKILSNKKLYKKIIDDKKFYKKTNAMKELNESKLNSPIILIDPTYKQRNASAGLSNEALLKFKKVAIEFLKKPSNEFFKKKNLKNELKSKFKEKLKIIKIKTNKQIGDISGTKGRKFYDYLTHQIKKEFILQWLSRVFPFAGADTPTIFFPSACSVEILFLKSALNILTFSANMFSIGIVILSPILKR